MNRSPMLPSPFSRGLHEDWGADAAMSMPPFGAEFRRFSLDRQKPGRFEDFYKLVVHTHHITNTEVTIGYADVHGDLLPINNDDNFCKAVSSANPLLRVFIQKRVGGASGPPRPLLLCGYTCIHCPSRLGACSPATLSARPDD
ncbi:hypothetical protein FD755_010681 [Muntiacus reevesi]|uniref:PB1 domain-containing protein n=1 Tax=Muntiacus reevesi TaxID=9886 RepID=A0A5N3XZ84_MUNRE|nr:hypothetical protein FD755_010681 [Muntiacus reevesi]